MKSFAFFIFMVAFSSSIAQENSTPELHVANFLDDFSESNIEGVVGSYFVESPNFIFGSHIFSPTSKSEVEEILLNIRTALSEKDYIKSSIERFET
ncbi:hypothetical protein BTJ40_12960 [Microbulbifer sp. A4B17]|uniref:hypothetical protein n=1 Tax=Microbulbifer sp. A4B17 TaxID=359370 RepID=UPI000D52ABCF|nr:hypothetical protein [Microbulbifer sp. A4B17]AWF81662.1 hypothetical protein BTJ40_12960 [Microbulbifer sp. A4B17]